MDSYAPSLYQQTHHDEPRGTMYSDKKTPAKSGATSSGMKTLVEEYHQEERKATAEEHKKIDDDFSLMLAKKESERPGVVSPTGKVEAASKTEKKRPPEMKTQTYESTAEFKNPDNLVEIRYTLQDTI